MKYIKFKFKFKFTGFSIFHVLDWRQKAIPDLWKFYLQNGWSRFSIYLNFFQDFVVLQMFFFFRFLLQPNFGPFPFLLVF